MKLPDGMRMSALLLFKELKWLPLSQRLRPPEMWPNASVASWKEMLRSRGDSTMLLSPKSGSGRSQEERLSALRFRDLCSCALPRLDCVRAATSGGAATFGAQGGRWVATGDPSLPFP
jgi:hypothetical protein